MHCARTRSNGHPIRAGVNLGFVSRDIVLGGLNLAVVDIDPPDEWRPQRRTPATGYLCPCANCDRQFTADHPVPYCSQKCRSVAKIVRYMRAVGSDRRTLDEDMLYALRVKMAHALGDGYAANRRRLSAEARRAVLDRDGGRCVLCGEAGSEIDHCNGDSNAIADLRLLCKACHREITSAQLVPVAARDALALRDEILRRATALVAERECDGNQWRGIWYAWTIARATAIRRG